MRFGPPRALGWPETDFLRKVIAKSGVETRIRALGTRFVAIFRFRKSCDVDYNLSSKIITDRCTQENKGGTIHQKVTVFVEIVSGRFCFFWGLPGPQGCRERIPRPILIKTGRFSAKSVP